VVAADRPAKPADVRLASLGADSFEIATERRGDYVVRIHHTPYWRVTAGEACVGRDGDWTRVSVSGPGTVRVEASFSLDGLLGEEEECSA
jgi:hypothetical protein